jgi:hypothetical protein
MTSREKLRGGPNDYQNSSSLSSLNINIKSSLTHGQSQSMTNLNNRLKEYSYKSDDLLLNFKPTVGTREDPIPKELFRAERQIRVGLLILAVDNQYKNALCPSKCSNFFI